ncbi:hypothetical protein F4824DRAFT_45640 [Ustulina deusta]|nr:hypothetical protein F4824DRAFT_45640 [Ustulina deusta]
MTLWYFQLPTNHCSLLTVSAPLVMPPLAWGDVFFLVRRYQHFPRCLLSHPPTSSFVRHTPRVLCLLLDNKDVVFSSRGGRCKDTDTDTVCKQYRHCLKKASMDRWFYSPKGGPTVQLRKLHMILPLD